jgi:hypothetical protein
MFRRFLSHFAVLAFVMHSQVARADDTVDYSNRGTWFEGIRSAPVSGYDLILVGAKVIFGENCNSASPENGYISVRTRSAAPLHLSIREQVPTYNYWLDQVAQASLVKTDRPNEKRFQWPLKPVLLRLAIEPSQLLPIVRIASAKPTADESVAPAAMCTMVRVPPKLDGYLFQFSVRNDSTLTARILRSDGTAVMVQKPAVQRGDIPYRVFWRPGSHRSGQYTLAVSGENSISHRALDYRVKFDHLW